MLSARKNTALDQPIFLPSFIRYVHLGYIRPLSAMSAINVGFDELSVALGYAFLGASSAPSSSAKESKPKAEKAPKVSILIPHILMQTLNI